MCNKHEGLEEVLESMIAREGLTYTQAISSLFSIINIGITCNRTTTANLLAQQCAEVLHAIKPESFPIEKMQNDVNMLLKLQAEALRSTDGPTTT